MCNHAKQTVTIVTTIEWYKHRASASNCISLSSGSDIKTTMTALYFSLCHWQNIINHDRFLFFVPEVSHEVRNPTSAVDGHCWLSAYLCNIPNVWVLIKTSVPFGTINTDLSRGPALWAAACLSPRRALQIPSCMHSSCNCQSLTCNCQFPSRTPENPYWGAFPPQRTLINTFVCIKFTHEVFPDDASQDRRCHLTTSWAQCCTD